MAPNSIPAKNHTGWKITHMALRIIAILIIFAIFVFLGFFAAFAFVIQPQPPLSGILANPALAGKDIQREVPPEVYAKWGIEYTSVPPAENAAGDYAEAAKLFVDFDDFFNIPKDTGQMRGSAYILPNRLQHIESYVNKHGWIPEAEELLPWIEANLPALKAFRRGAAKEQCVFPMYYDPAKPLSTLNRSFPIIFDLLDIIRFSPMYSFYLAHQGKITQAVDVQLDMMKAERHISASASSTTYFLGRGLFQSITWGCLNTLMFYTDVPRDQLVRIKNELTQTIENKQPLKRFLKRERAMDLARLSDCYRGYISFELRHDFFPREVSVMSTPDTAWKRLKLFWLNIRYPLEQAKKEVNSYFDLAEELVALPPWEALARNDELIVIATKLEENSSPVSHFIIKWSPFISYIRANIDPKIYLIMTALALYKKDTGAYPQTLDVLVPDYLNAIPIDDASGKPLHYRLEEKRYIVWSTGANGVDDGGTIDYFGDFTGTRNPDYIFITEFPKIPPEHFEWPPKWYTEGPVRKRLKPQTDDAPAGNSEQEE